MARSPKDDPRYNNTWNYCAEAAENCAPGALNERNQTPITPNSNILPDHSMYMNANYSDDVYLNKNPYNVPKADAVSNNLEDKVPFNDVPRPSQNYGNAMLKLGNGQLVRVLIDENHQHLIFPMSGQYELFNPNQGVLDSPLQTSQPRLYTLNQDFSTNNNVNMPPLSVTQNSGFQEMNSQPQKPHSSSFFNDLLGNLEPTTTGTYSPFGQNYPLNHPDLTNLNLLHNNSILEAKNLSVKTDKSPKRNENSPLADTSNKKRIVAEVKPMRPSYSDVLAKNTKIAQQADIARKTKPQNIETKSTNNKPNTKLEKLATNAKQDENKFKNDKKQNSNTISSGSESGDINTDDNEKRQKPAKKSKNKRSNMSRKWSSLDDITNEEDNSFTHENDSQFVFIENHEKPKKDKKSDKPKTCDKSSLLEDDFKFDEEDINSSFYHEGQGESGKSKKKKDARGFHRPAKTVLDKKKTNQTKVRRNKPGYCGVAQNYLENWGGASWKALVWFFYLLSDICGMSLHLSFDLCTSVFTQTYVSSQAVWRSSKDWFAKIGDNKYLMYIDRKLGHTKLGFWRKLKWFNKDDDSDSGGNGDKLNANIPLPATGEEAMKRLLACKGKDPYSILGVSVTCSDEEIKRYYRRQAFLVHPDKNQQPGAEEAFKILQHAFDLIGEPERREEYSRRTLESQHAEAAWGELSELLAQLHDKMEFAANTIRCTNCGRRHKRVLTERPCYAARYCAQCKIRHSAKEGDIWAESSMMGLLVMYYACMDGAVYQITQWASCQKKNLKQLRPDCHAVQYRIVLGNKAAASDLNHRPSTGHDPNLEEFLNNLYSKSTGVSPATPAPPAEPSDAKKRRNKKTKA